MNEQNLTFVDAAGMLVAEITLSDEENGWYFGQIASQSFSPKLKEALDWYDEVVEHQMLSYLDKALASVDQFELRVRFPNGASRPVYSLQINRQNEVSFRTTPVLPPAWLSKSESA